MFYEIAGTIGPITAVKLIDSVGENISFFLSPVSLALAGLVWFFIPTEVLPPAVILYQPAGYLRRYGITAYFNLMDAYPYVDSQIMSPFWVDPFGKGVSLCLATAAATSGLSPAIHLHSLRTGKTILLGKLERQHHVLTRYLENNIANIYAKGVIQIIVGSNLGELLGATMVFFTVEPIPS